jgi:hypothetical protein
MGAREPGQLDARWSLHAEVAELLAVSKAWHDPVAAAFSHDFAVAAAGNG